MRGKPKCSTCNEAVFSAPFSQEAEYWAGLLATDGNLYKVPKGTRTRVLLALNDRHLVQEFQSFVGGTPVREVYTNRLSKKPSYHTSVSSNQIFNDLLSLGITPKKSLTLKVANSLSASRHFWRGAMDGDGTICRSRRLNNYLVGLSSGSFAFIEQFQGFVSNALGEQVAARRHNHKRAKSPHWSLRLSGVKARKLVDCIYKDFPQPFLRRKFAAAMQFLSDTKEHGGRLQLTPRKGLLIVVESQDGGGKGSQVPRIVSHLREKFGQSAVVQTKEPGGTPLGDHIRCLLFKDPGMSELAPGVIDLLFFTSHLQNWKTLVEPSLEAGKIVVSDRWFYSEMAYMTQRTVPAPVADFYARHHGRPADLLIFLHGSSEVLFNRANSRTTEKHQTFKPWNELKMQEKIQEAYVDFFSDKDEWHAICVDGKDEEQVWLEVQHAVDFATRERPCTS